MNPQPAPAGRLARVHEARVTIQFFRAIGDGTMTNRAVTFTRNGDGTLTLLGADFHPEGVFARIAFPQTVALTDRGGERLTLTLDYDRRQFTHAATSTPEADAYQNRVLAICLKTRLRGIEAVMTEF